MFRIARYEDIEEISKLRIMQKKDDWKELKQMIPNLNGSCADIDGVIVLPEYRGHGLQKTYLN